MSAVLSVPEPGRSRGDDEVARLRIPPHSIEAEQSVLGGLLIDNGAWDRAGDLLIESDFYRYEHRLIYAAIGALINATKPADVITVFEQLQALGKAEECGGLTYLNALAQSVPSAANMRRYAEIVRERAILRKLVAASDEIATNAFNPQGRPVSQILDEAEGKIFKIGEEGSRARQGFQSMDSLVVQLIDRVTELAENGAEEVTGVRTGFYDLDRMTAGLQPGDLIVLAARPSMGKTAFALNIAEHVAVQEGLPVVVFSMEMGASQLALRLVGSLGRIDQQHLRTGTPARRRMGPPDRGGRQARQGQHLHRRDAGAVAERAARARPAPGAPVRPARPDRGRLPAADERQRRRQRGEPRHRDRRDLARPEVARQGAAVPGDRAVAAQPQRRDAHRQAADDERPARIGRHRAGRRRHHVHLPRRLLQQGAVARSPASPRSSSASSVTARSARSSWPS